MRELLLENPSFESTFELHSAGCDAQNTTRFKHVTGKVKLTLRLQIPLRCSPQRPSLVMWCLYSVANHRISFWHPWIITKNSNEGISLQNPTVTHTFSYFLQTATTISFNRPIGEHRQLTDHFVTNLLILTLSGETYKWQDIGRNLHLVDALFDVIPIPALTQFTSSSH